MVTDPTPEAELRERLRAFAAAEHVLIALDFDGVLAPLIPDPTQSRPVPEASRALERLADAPGVDLAVVSGRPAEDLNRSEERRVGKEGRAQMAAAKDRE